MEVDISQIGQNFALRSANQQSTRSTEQSEEDRQQRVQALEAEKNSKAIEESADNESSLDSDPDVLENAVSDVSEFLQASNRSLAFSVDPESQRPVVKVTDSESGQVIRQIPSEEVLALSQRIKELQSDVGAAVGVLFNKQV